MAFDALAATAAVLVTTIPGVALGFAALHGTKFSRLDKTILGASLGIIALPLLLFLEYFVLGWNLTAALVLANALLLLLGGIGAYYLQAHAFEFRMPSFKLDTEHAKKYGPAAFVLLMMALAFYVRFAPISTSNTVRLSAARVSSTWRNALDLCDSREKESTTVSFCSASLAESAERSAPTSTFFGMV